MDKKFYHLGTVMFTSNVDERAKKDLSFARFVWHSLFNKYMKCDWGNLSDNDRERNDYAVEHGERVHAQYDAPGQPRIWVITEWDRSVTTVLFPEEY